jgi:sarcosine oxidase subunit delta
MLLIECPWCGPRGELEFSFGGPSHVERPGPPESVSDETWAKYLHTRDNPKGLHLERWRHTHGCRQWFNVARDTVTHRISAVYRMGEARPESLKGRGS